MPGKTVNLACGLTAALIAIASWGATAPKQSSGAQSLAPVRPTALAHFAMDPAASRLNFEFTQAGARTVGKFKSVSGTLDRAPNGSISNLRVLVDVKSLDTADTDRDKQLAQKELFAVAQFPQAIFQTGATPALVSGTSTGLNGSLTLRNITRPVAIPVSVELQQTGATANSVRLRGQVPLKRLDFDVGQGEWKSTEWVANEVLVKFDVVYRLTVPHKP